MLCMASSSVFGIFLLVTTSFAQSAPYPIQDQSQDEEAVIDRLASIVGSQQFTRPRLYPDYELSDYPSEITDDVLIRKYLSSLPKQFGYRPDDVRYYLPAEKLPNWSGGEGGNKADFESSKYRNPKEEADYGQQDHIETDYESEHPRPDEENPYHYMKKNEIKETEPAQHSQHIIAEPSNIISSGHSVEKPYHISYPADNDSFTYSDIYYIGLVAGCSAAVVIGLVAAGIFWYRIHQRVKASQDLDYPAYGVVGPAAKSKDVSPSGGDRKLAQSAQMYHYQHQKQQMAAMQKGATQGTTGSDVESEEDNDDDNDYTVYECPGLAPAGEMEVKNPLFEDEATPVTPHLKSGEDEN